MYVCALQPISSKQRSNNGNNVTNRQQQHLQEIERMNGVVTSARK